MAQRARRQGLVTIVDVAREANVSYSTVSRVLNHYPHVRSEKRERVVAAMERLGFVANPVARSLAGGQTQMVGLVVIDLMTEYVAQILLGIDDELVSFHYDLTVYTTHYRRAKETNYIHSLTQGLVDGLLLILPLDPGAYSDTLRKIRFPYVVIDHQGFDSYSSTVGATNFRGAREATEYLLQLGHRRIGFVAGSEYTNSAFERLEGYRAALAAFDIPFDPSLVQSGNFQQPGGFEAAQRLLDLLPSPTAIFAANDLSAFGAIEAIRSRGLNVPDDISVIGFDDIPRAGYVYPPLTTVRQPLTEIGRAAVRLLLKHIEDPQRPVERITLDTTLIIRATCQPPAHRR